jgi:hypothetical protein
MQMVELTPREGTPGTLFERLRDYVSAIDLTWTARIRPVDEALLRRYVQLSGRGNDLSAIPESFRQTALSIGADAGGLFEDFRIDTNLEEVVSLYEEWQQFEPHAINADLPVVALYIVGAQMSLDMRTGAEPPVVESSNGYLMGPRARSWEAFVMQAAIHYGERRRLPSGCWCSCSVNDIIKALGGVAAAVAAIDDFAAHEGLPIAWPSDDLVRIAVHPTSSIFAHVTEETGVLLHAFSADPTFLRRVNERLATTLGAGAGGELRWNNGVLRGNKT